MASPYILRRRGNTVAHIVIVTSCIHAGGAEALKTITEIESSL